MSMIALSVVAFVAAGCGGTLECGDGTMESDGACVPAAESCGDGTKLLEGRCVRSSAPVTCAAGTTKEDGECVPDTTCGPDTRADATGECVPTYDQVMCGQGTTREGEECVTTRFLIEDVGFPDQVTAAPADDPDGNLQELSVSWSGEPEWPVTVRAITTGECPSDLFCGTARWEIEASPNPIEIPDAYGCYGSAAGRTFQKGVLMVDNDGTYTNLGDMTFDCVD
jgi:hypothetical protein